MKKNKFNFQLMANNILKEDIEKVKVFLSGMPVLTQSKKVSEFEKKWSKWLGVKYSVFVNSAATKSTIENSTIEDSAIEGSKITKSKIILPVSLFHSLFACACVHCCILSTFSTVENFATDRHTDRQTCS